MSELHCTSEFVFAIYSYCVVVLGLDTFLGNVDPRGLRIRTNAGTFRVILRVV